MARDRKQQAFPVPVDNAADVLRLRGATGSGCRKDPCGYGWCWHRCQGGASHRADTHGIPVKWDCSAAPSFVPPFVHTATNALSPPEPGLAARPLPGSRASATDQSPPGQRGPCPRTGPPPLRIQVELGENTRRDGHPSGPLLAFASAANAAAQLSLCCHSFIAPHFGGDASTLP